MCPPTGELCPTCGFASAPGDELYCGSPDCPQMTDLLDDKLCDDCRATRLARVLHAVQIADAIRSNTSFESESPFESGDEGDDEREAGRVEPYYDSDSEQVWSSDSYSDESSNGSDDESLGYYESDAADNDRTGRGDFIPGDIW